MRLARVEYLDIVVGAGASILLFLHRDAGDCGTGQIVVRQDEMCQLVGNVAGLDRMDFRPEERRSLSEHELIIQRKTLGNVYCHLL